MTDDKVIDAALDAWFGNPDWRDPSTFDWDHDPRKDMRAALAAADKVRAEGKLPDIPDNAFICAFYDERGNYMGDIGAEPFRAHAVDAAFAAGLAKGEAERAAIEKVRDEWCAEYTKARDDRAALVEVLHAFVNIRTQKQGEGEKWSHILLENAFDRAVTALSLVQKGGVRDDT